MPRYKLYLYYTMCIRSLKPKLFLLMEAIFFLVICIFAKASYADVTFTSSQKTLIKSLTLTKEAIAQQHQKAEPSNQYRHNKWAKKLGKILFFDVRLSRNHQISCASCHNFLTGLSDSQTIAQGLGQGSRNTPTLINAFMQRWYFWDGRADSLWLQALGSIESQVEMDGDWEAIYHVLINDRTLHDLYNKIFIKTPIVNKKPFLEIDIDRFKTNIAKSIAAFVLDIKQFNSPFDDFADDIQSNNHYLTLNQQRGLQLFLGKANCITCHFGPNFSDGEFHNIRLISQLSNPKDSGRYGAIALLKNNPLNILGEYSDIPTSDTTSKAKTQYLKLSHNTHNHLWAAYKTPTLRNITQTAPYMHDGSLHTLEQVIEHYSTFEHAAPNRHKNNSRLLQPLNLTKEEKSQLVDFLHSLTGTIEVPVYE